MSEAWSAGPHRSPEPLQGDRKGRPYISAQQTRVDNSLAPDQTKQGADASGRFVAGDLASL